MSCAAVFERVEGDSGPDFSTTLEGVTISTLTSFDLVMKRADGVTITKPRVIDDDDNGVVHFEWVATDLVPGQHTLEYRIVDGSGNADTLPEGEPMVLRVRGRV